MQAQVLAPSPTPATFEDDRARLAAVRRRDARADGQFYYAVLTTGVYCRPSCAARPARAENVRFYDTRDSAERAGFRACKRCKPERESATEDRDRVLALVRERLEKTDAPVSLAELAEAAQLSPYHLHRIFKKHVGMTPREYAAAVRLSRASSELRDGASVTQAIYEAGYSSSSRFYETGSGALGVTPRELRRGGAGVEVRSALRQCSLGKVLIAATSRGVCLIAFGDSERELSAELRERFPQADLQASNDEIEALADRVVGMIDRSELAPDLPLDLIGTAFQQRVWRALREIPAGETRSYTQIAKRVGSPGAVRAVGSACGKNPVAVVVPCHRVIRDDGELGGYRWGLDRKRALLARERKQKSKQK
jgi:AraC family transcriptional regulator, regulatory protein of adaptative response / methylated-DNA-[protein]-cysteine methyltransferase